MTDAVLEGLRQDVKSLRVDFHRIMGTRLSRQGMAERLDISISTLMRRVKNGTAPRPNADGKWLLSEVLEWESKH
jgi:predicted DNA-binding transcriptional regulator AlpA